MSDILVKIGTTLWLIGSLLVLLFCWFIGHHLLGMYLFLGSLVLLVAAIALIARHRKNNDADTITNAGRIARFSKHVPTKTVYENDSSVWEQMKGEDTGR